MKKILIVNDLLAGGGVEKLLVDFVERWHDTYDITVMTIYKHRRFDELFPENVKYIYKTVPKTTKGKFSKAYVRCMAQKAICRYRYNKLKANNDFDVVIALKDGEVTKIISEFNNPRKFSWCHTDYKHHYYTQSLYGGAENERQALEKYTNVVCVSEDIKKSLIEVLGDTGNYVVKYNPLNVDFIQYQGNEPVNDIEKDPDRPLFVAVGRINYQKGFDLLLEAAHMLEEDGYKFDVVVVGGKENWGDEYKRIMRSMDRLHIQNVKFIGLRSNPQKYMKMADWLLSTSIFEGYSLVSQEAAILGTPLLLTDCSGVRELVGDNEYGLVMEPSVKGIYEGMKKVLDDPSLQKHYKEKILERRKIIDQDQRFREIEEMLFSE